MTVPTPITPLSERRPAPVVRLGASAGDEELLAAARDGTPWARAALLDRHGAMVERLVRRILGHDPDLEDRVHDAFVAILRSLDGVRDPGALRSWMATVAVHTAHRAIRRRKLERAVFFWRPSAPEPFHAGGFEERDTLRRVYAVLDRLPAACRVAFALHHIEQMTVEEAASAAGTPPTTFKRRLARAERRFAALARADAELRPWLKEGRWTDP